MSGRSPSFQHYPDRLLSHTRHLSLEADGFFRRIQDYMWLHSPDYASIANNVAEWVIAAGCSPDVAERCMEEIQNPYHALLKEEKGRLVCHGLRRKREEQEKLSKIRSDAAKARYANAAKNPANAEEKPANAGKSPANRLQTVGVGVGVGDGGTTSTRGPSTSKTLSDDPPKKKEVIAFVMKELELPKSDGEYLYLNWCDNDWINTKSKRPIKDWKQTARKWKAGFYFPSQKNGEPPRRRRVVQQEFPGRHVGESA